MRGIGSGSVLEAISMLNYPLKMSFKILAINPQVKVTDAAGQTVLYVKEKAFSLKIDINIYSDEGQKQQLYHVKADKVLAMNVPFSITTPEGALVGKVVRPGMRSLWKATYQIFDPNNVEVAVVHEENPWIKVADSLLSDVPLVHMLLNPAYLVDTNGQTVLYLKKQPSLVDRQFLLEKRADVSEANEKLLVPGVLLAMMLERMRG
jgi:uncharacterized protein YxjI